MSQLGFLPELLAHVSYVGYYRLDFSFCVSIDGGAEGSLKQSSRSGSKSETAVRDTALFQYEMQRFSRQLLIFEKPHDVPAYKVVA
jgi:hypothetical protein